MWAIKAFWHSEDGRGLCWFSGGVSSTQTCVCFHRKGMTMELGEGT